MQAIGGRRMAPPVHQERLRPERTALYRLVQQHAASFIARTEAGTGAELPRFIKDESVIFLDGGILPHGSLRLRCGDCVHDKLVALSCKRRGHCPSRGARRMSKTTERLDTPADPQSVRDGLDDLSHAVGCTVFSYRVSQGGATALECRSARERAMPSTHRNGPAGPRAAKEA